MGYAPGQARAVSAEPSQPAALRSSAKVASHSLMTPGTMAYAAAQGSVMSTGSSIPSARVATSGGAYGAPSTSSAGHQDPAGFGEATSAIERASELLAKVSQRKEDPTISVGQPAQASYEQRLDRLEDTIHGFDKLLRQEQKPDSDEELLLRHITQMAEELEASRRTRQRLEERAIYLDELLKKERGEREAWMEEFLSSLTTTLKDLTVAVDRSLEDNTQAVGGRIDETEAMIERLVGRVNTLMVQAPSGRNVRNGASIASATGPSRVG